MPVLMRIDRPAILPNQWKSKVQACHVTGAATGDLSSERVLIRLDRLSCVSQSGETLDIKASGYVVGGDGKTGLRGRLITKSGQALANAVSLSILSGAGKAISLSSQQISTSTLTGTQTVDYSSAWKAGMGQGAADAMSRLVDYYLKLADKILPVLEVDAGTSADIVFSQGTALSNSNK
jgi:conjugal transfer protein traB